MKTIRLIAICAAALALSGCATTSSLADRLRAFEALGVTEAEIGGKFTHTKYTATVQGGKVVHELTHSNPWVTRVHLVREVPAPR